MTNRKRDEIARIVAGDATTGWSRFQREADEILAEAYEVIEWRFGFAEPQRVLHLARLLAADHARRDRQWASNSI